MAYNPVPTVATGDLWTASNHNTYIRDNFAAVQKLPTWGFWSNAAWDVVPKNIGTYTVNASDWGLPSSGIGAIILQISAKWSSYLDGYMFRAKKVGSAGEWLQVRSHNSLQFFDAYGMIPLINNQFDLQIVGANAQYVVVKIFAYFPE